MGLGAYDYYGAQQQQRQQSQQPSPYMSPSSAGNPASSYGSSGGAQAGSYGTPAPTYSYAQQKQSQQQAVQGYRAPAAAASAPTTNYPTYTGPKPPGAPNYTPPAGYSPYGTPGNYVTSGSPSGQYYNQSPNNSVVYFGDQPSGPTQQPQQQIWNPNAPRYNPQTGQWETPQPGYQQVGTPPPGWSPQGLPPQYDPRVTGPSGVMPGGQPPPQNADTNGYQAPQVVVPPASRYAMPGWDNGKWNDPNNQDPKYVVGRILSSIPGRTDQMDIATARIAAAYPGTTRVGNGDINIPGVGTIDVLMGAGAGGRGWWWGAGQQGGGTTPQATPAGGTDWESLIRTLTQPPQQQVQAQQYDITKDPQYLKLQQQLAALQTQQQTYQAEQAAAARQGGGVNHPSFAYY